jgi:hypothetical protein
MDQEVWKDIEWAPNYLVSNRGNIQNRQTGRILKINHTRGRRAVNIPSNDGRYVTRSVSNIQAEAFGLPIVKAGRPKGSKSELKTWRIDPMSPGDPPVEIDRKEATDYRSYRIAGEEV